MIKVNKSLICLEGTSIVLYAELGVCISNMLSNKIITEDELDELIETAKKHSKYTDEEIKNELSKTIIDDVIKKILQEVKNNGK